MDGGQIAVFAVQDMLLFFLTWELELIPVYLLLAIWGGKNRQYAATKFIIYTAGSSIFILLAALAWASMVLKFLTLSFLTWRLKILVKNSKYSVM